jgi:hypothetical protein
LRHIVFKGSTELIKKGLWVIGSLLLFACVKTIPAVKVAEEPMVEGCAHIATLTETTDPGRVLDNYRPTEHQAEILRRAENLGATHVVWLHDYRIGSAANAYRCDH